MDKRGRERKTWRDERKNTENYEKLCERQMPDVTLLLSPFVPYLSPFLVYLYPYNTYIPQTGCSLCRMYTVTGCLMDCASHWQNNIAFSRQKIA